MNLTMRNQATVNSITVGDTWVMSPSVVPQVRIGYNRFGGLAEPTSRFSSAGPPVGWPADGR